MVATTDLLAHIRSRLRPIVSGDDVSFGFVVDPAGTYLLTLRSGLPAISQVPFFKNGDCDVVITISEVTLRNIISGQVAPMTAYLSGFLKVSGPLGTARRLGVFFT